MMSGEGTFVGLVECMGPQLTSTVVQDRIKGMDLLANVFTSLPFDFLKEKELDFITEFLCNRLKDQHLVIPKVIQSIYPVVSIATLSSLHAMHSFMMIRKPEM